jgi:hypothetical protein
MDIKPDVVAILNQKTKSLGRVSPSPGVSSSPVIIKKNMPAMFTIELTLQHKTENNYLVIVA